MDSIIRVRDVKAARGVSWMRGGWDLFRYRPGAWAGFALGWLAVTFGLILVPLIGGVIANFLQPVFFASFAIAARKQLAGEKVEIGDLFAGFKRNARALINVGALQLLAGVAIVVLMDVMGLPQMASSGGQVPNFVDYLKQLEGNEWIVVVGFGLLVVVKGALWFAPPLLAFHEMSTLDAIRWSVYAALSNFGALLVYGATLFILFFVATIPWGLGLALAIPVMLASTYIGYVEVFEETPVEAN
jgi:membrane-anchored glycerophosphoryl diester phosphodiesterase (GDPDase)